MAATSDTGNGTSRSAATARSRRRREPDGPGILPLVAIGLAVVGVVNPEVAGLCVIGLLPTIVLAMTDKHYLKNLRTQCIAFTNLSGVLPFAVQLWDQPDQFVFMVTNMVTLAIMFGAAGLGYVMLYLGPVVSAALQHGLNQDRLKKINSQRQKLIEEWGPDVAETRSKSAEEKESDGKIKLATR